MTSRSGCRVGTLKLRLGVPTRSSNARRVKYPIDRLISKRSRAVQEDNVSSSKIWVSLNWALSMSQEASQRVVGIVLAGEVLLELKCFVPPSPWG